MILEWLSLGTKICLCSSDTEGAWASRGQGLRAVYERGAKGCDFAKSSKSTEERGEFWGWASRRKRREQVWASLLEREGILCCGEPGEDREMEKGYGARGFEMAPFSSRPIRRHLAAIFLRASSCSVTTKPMSSNGANSP